MHLDDWSVSNTLEHLYSEGVTVAFVLFDLGGVLCDVEPIRAEAVWATAGLAPGSIVELMDQSGAKPGGDVGRFDAGGMARALSAHLGVEVSLDLLHEVWGAMVSWRPFVDPMLSRLRVPYGVLSTIDPIHSSALGRLKGASPVVFSWEIGVVKPHREAFLRTLARCNSNPGYILYLEARTENVDQARACGMQAQQVTCAQEVLGALRPFMRGD